MTIRKISMLLLVAAMLTAVAAFGQVHVAISIGPPPIPVYEQPPCPSEGYLWTPGYWAYDYDDNDYYWVPGTWVEPPQVGYFWTPGWWGWEGAAFNFHEGYWGPHVGFYGGINYGFGYFGNGFEGGRWDHDHFFYNRSVTNVNVTVIHNVYNTTVINRTENRISFNGGNGGINMRPTAEQESFDRERHVERVEAQTRNMEEARREPQQRAAMNHGRPDVAATPRPADFRNREVVHASQAGGGYNPPVNRNVNNVPRPGNENEPRPGNNNVPRPGNNNVIHAKDLPQRDRLPAPNTGDARRDQKYQQQQEKTYAKQEQERQKLQVRQDQEHQRYQQQKANDQRQQQLEQRHQQQTQKLQQHQDQQMQKMQTRQQPRPPKH